MEATLTGPARLPVSAKDGVIPTATGKRSADLEPVRQCAEGQLEELLCPAPTSGIVKVNDDLDLAPLAR